MCLSSDNGASKLYWRTMNRDKLFLTARQVSEHLDISLRTIQRLSKMGVIKSFKLGGKWRYVREDIEKYGTNFITAKQVSEFFGIPLNTIYCYSRQGKIKSFKIGDQWRYLRADIEKYVSDNTDFSKEPERKQDTFLEHRSYPRINTNFMCQYSISLPPFKNINSDGLIKNISAGGVFISDQNGLMNEVEIDDPIDVNFVLASYGIQARGKVVRKTDMGAGIKFKDIDGEMTKRIMEYAS